MFETTRAPITLCILLCLAACAKRHDEIAPELIEPGAYAQASCRDLARMHAKTTRALIFSELVQDKHYHDDRIRTFGAPTLMATLFDEDAAPEVARLKGDALALAAQMQRAGCILPVR
ncbi:hypothetical protein [Methylocystis echinoides]|jgi:hypothetical protein|uniref:hypothetical protein n=1 Tax=Methylocystis echinoides TaxID=29468 RepID=UPI0034142CF3